MATPNILTIFLCSQVVVVIVIVFVLKKVLNGNLVDLAITQLESGQVVADSPTTNIVIITHQSISASHRERILKAISKRIPGAGVPEFRVDGKLLGGMIIKAGTQVVDYSLVDRLRRAR